MDNENKEKNETNENEENENNGNIKKCDSRKSISKRCLIFNKTYFPLIVLIIAVITLGFQCRANKRAVKLFVGQNKPLIEVSPIGISQIRENHCITFFSILNYSGFVAKEIGIDVRFGPDSNAYIGEWEKARNDAKKKGDKKGVVKDHIYLSEPHVLIQELKDGETVGKDCKYNHPYDLKSLRSCKGKHPNVTGSLRLESVWNKDNHVYPAFVRITWKNENGHLFDEIHEYTLLCTKDIDANDPNAGSGISFTFIPKGVTSHKGKQ